MATEQREQEQVLGDRVDLAFETGFSAPDKLDYLNRARVAGYFVRLFFVGTESPTINAARVAQRRLSGGHEVSIRKIVERYFRSMALARAAVRSVDRMYLYDNSIDGADAQRVARLRSNSDHSRCFKNYIDPLPVWAKQIVDGGYVLPAEQIDEDAKRTSGSIQI